MKQAFNPYLESYEYIPDAEPRVFDGRLYIYGSHDIFNSEEFCMGDYICYSAPLNDLGNFRCEGVIYKKTQDPANKDGKMFMWAPDVIKGKDNRYYLYYGLHRLPYLSIAVSDKPNGPFEFYDYIKDEEGIPYGKRKGQSLMFDPSIFIDDDDSVYLYAGFAPEPCSFKDMYEAQGNRVDYGFVLKLKDDMKTVIAEEKPTIPGPLIAKGTSFEDHPFLEASSMRKINGKYYLVYSSTLSHELCYAISDYPDRDFVYGGTIISIGDIGYKGNKEANNYLGNTHGGIVKLNDDWYIFYHRQTNKSKCARQGSAEKIVINKDGSIDQVEMTSCGLNKGPLKGLGLYEAYIACNLASKYGTFAYLESHEEDKDLKHPYFTQSGIDRESNGDQYIANMMYGSWCAFKYFEFVELKEIIIGIKGKGKGLIEVRTEKDKSPILEIVVNQEKAIKEFKGALDKPISGTWPLYFTYIGDGYLDFHYFILK